MKFFLRLLLTERENSFKEIKLVDFSVVTFEQVVDSLSIFVSFPLFFLEESYSKQSLLRSSEKRKKLPEAHTKKKILFYALDRCKEKKCISVWPIDSVEFFREKKKFFCIKCVANLYFRLIFKQRGRKKSFFQSTEKRIFNTITTKYHVKAFFSKSLESSIKIWFFKNQLFKPFESIADKFMEAAKKKNPPGNPHRIATRSNNKKRPSEKFSSSSRKYQSNSVTSGGDFIFKPVRKKSFIGQVEKCEFGRTLLLLLPPSFNFEFHRIRKR